MDERILIRKYMFRKIIASIAMALTVITSFAAQTTVDVSGLSEAQVAELKSQAAAAVARAAKVVENPAAADICTHIGMAATWGTQAAAAAEGFAKAIGIAAKELGVTVNDFLHTDAGRLTAMLIIWKLAGAAAIKMMYGALFVTVGLSISRMLYLRLFTKGYEKVEYSRLGGLFKGTKLIRVPKGFKDLEDDGEWLAFWVMIALTIGTLVIGGMFF
jgi:hypothetical protein